MPGAGRRKCVFFCVIGALSVDLKRCAAQGASLLGRSNWRVSLESFRVVFLLSGAYRQLSEVEFRFWVKPVGAGWTSDVFPTSIMFLFFSCVWMPDYACIYAMFFLVLESLHLH